MGSLDFTHRGYDPCYCLVESEGAKEKLTSEKETERCRQ